jgi:hypothetical protein
MTDKQQKIFQKMVNGEISLSPWSNGYWVGDEFGYVNYISKAEPEWGDYEKAWEAYENAPLVKAMK